MPQLERGDIAGVCRRARQVAQSLGAWIERGWDVIAPVPSCALMMKTLWPLHLPEDEAVARLARHTSDISEYVIDIARSEGLAEVWRRSTVMSRSIRPATPEPRTSAPRLRSCCV